MSYPNLPPSISELLREGTVIPAHPLALTKARTFDEKRQGRLTQYYIASGAGGVAVGVHTTQFAIRNPEVNLLEPVLRSASEQIRDLNLQRPFIKVAGIVGPTQQALREAELAVKYGYHLGLVSMGGLDNQSESDLIKRLEAIAELIPVFGFYLQPAVGGRLLSFDFWKDAASIPNMYAIKVAAFDRYQTLDVVRAVCESPRCDDIALYTGNDDNIVADLLTAYRFNVGEKVVEKRFVGGLLGHWAVWTGAAVKLLARIKQSVNDNSEISELLSIGIKVTDMNAAVFDSANAFHGCIPGIHEILRRQGLLEGIWCLNPEEKLSKGQMEEIDRVYAAYADLTDDELVKDFFEKTFSHHF
jgi:hypothetical protein